MPIQILASILFHDLTKSLASYFGNLGKFSMVFSIVFLAIHRQETSGKEIIEGTTGPVNLMLNIPEPAATMKGIY
jgi:hypothetical protein